MRKQSGPRPRGEVAGGSSLPCSEGSGPIAPVVGHGGVSPPLFVPGEVPVLSAWVLYGLAGRHGTTVLVVVAATLEDACRAVGVNRGDVGVVHVDREREKRYAWRFERLGKGDHREFSIQ